MSNSCSLICCNGIIAFLRFNSYKYFNLYYKKENVECIKIILAYNTPFTFVIWC